jgi:hypothetical protein
MPAETKGFTRNWRAPSPRPIFARYAFSQNRCAAPTVFGIFLAGPSQWLSVKITEIVVSTSTGSPLISVGEYCHSLTARIAASSSTQGPFST